MRIIVLRKMEYNGYFIYIRQFEWEFEYLLADNKGEIFADRVLLKPSLKRRILSFLRMGTLYTKDQVDEGEKIALTGAMETIDKFAEPGFEAVRRKVYKKQKKGKCVWQTRETDDGPYYVCLKHKKVVKMIDGQKPSHN